MYACLCSHSLPLPGTALTLFTNPDLQTAAVQLTDGTVHKYTSSSSLGLGGLSSLGLIGGGGSSEPSLSPWLLPDGREMKFPDTCCEHVAIAEFKNKVHFVINLLVNVFFLRK